MMESAADRVLIVEYDELWRALRHYLQASGFPVHLSTGRDNGSHPRHNDAFNSFMQVDSVTIDPAARCVQYRGQPVRLTTLEFNLLHALARCAGQVVSRESLVPYVLGRPYSPFDRSLDMLVSRLRKKLAAVGLADRIKTVRCEGYQFATRTVSFSQPVVTSSGKSASTL